MNETKRIYEANTHIFIENLVDAVKDGYYVESSNYGWIIEANGVKDITLIKDENKVYPQAELGEFVISEYCTQTFLHKLCVVVAQGGKVDLDTLWWDVSGIKSVKGSVYLIPQYNKAQLAEMEWDELKSVLKELGVTGRDRTLLVNNYLKMTGQEL